MRRIFVTFFFISNFVWYVGAFVASFKLVPFSLPNFSLLFIWCHAFLVNFSIRFYFLLQFTLNNCSVCHEYLATRIIQINKSAIAVMDNWCKKFKWYFIMNRTMIAFNVHRTIHSHNNTNTPYFPIVDFSRSHGI